MVKQIKYLIENFSDLFSDTDDLFGDRNDIFNNNAVSKSFFKNDLSRVLIEHIGTDCPRAWKKGTDEDGNDIVYHHPKNGLYTMGAYILKVYNALKLAGWKVYNVGDVYALPYSMDSTITQIYKKYKHELPSDWMIERVKQQKLEFDKQMPIPDFVNKLFKDKTGTYKQILVSPDNGIMFTYLTGMYSLQDSRYIDTWAWNGYSYKWQKAVIKLTGEVIYNEIDSKTAKEKHSSFKDAEKRKAFLLLRIKKSAGTACTIKEIVITPSGLPMGITYFEWDEWLTDTKQYKKHSYPIFVKKLVEKGYNVLSSFEKSDPNSIYECEKDGLSFKFYKEIDTSKLNEMNILSHGVWDPIQRGGAINKNLKYSSCIICELTDYNLELFKELFNIVENDDQN